MNTSLIKQAIVYNVSFLGTGVTDVNLKTWIGADLICSYLVLMYKTAVYTLVNGAITHKKPQI